MRRRTVLLVVLFCLVGGAPLAWVAVVWVRGLPLAEARHAFDLGQFQAAAQLAEERLAGGHPNDRAAMLLAARAYAKLNRWAEAEAYFVQVTISQREDLRLRARGLEARKLWTESALVYEELYKRWRNDGDALQHLAAIRAQQDRPQEALILARQLARLPSYEAIGHVLSGMMEHEIRNEERAAREFEEALRLSPELKGVPAERSQVLLWLTEALVDLGRAADAEKYALEVRQLSSGAEPCHLLGQARLQLGDEDGARSYWIEATARNPNYVPALLELAKFHLRAGELEEALRWCRRALDVEPDNTAAKFLFDTIKRRIEQLEKSKKAPGAAPPPNAGPDREK